MADGLPEGRFTILSQVSSNNKNPTATRNLVEDNGKGIFCPADSAGIGDWELELIGYSHFFKCRGAYTGIQDNLLYAYDDRDKGIMWFPILRGKNVYTYICSSSSKLSFADSDLQYLDKRRKGRLVCRHR